jgi:threonine/homoserine/homoserine lactone efflux protein
LLALEQLLPLLVGIVLAQASPGPNMLAVASVSLGSGRGAGLLTVAGVATGALIWSVLFAFGAGALLTAFPELVTAMKLIGGGYLLFIAVKALRSAFTKTPAVAAQRVKRSRWRAYLTGLAVVLTNPKAALMWIAIALFLAASGIGNMGYVGVGLYAACTALLVYGSYALLFSTGLAARTYGRFQRWIEGLFGVVFGALGGKLVFDGIVELRP